MKNKKYFIIFIILFLIILIGGYYILRIVKNKKEENILQDYTPEQEITEEQNRQTIVSLYFINKETKQISPEARLIDITEIINNCIFYCLYISFYAIYKTVEFLNV